MAKLKCLGCKQRFPAESMIKFPAGNGCSFDCVAKHQAAKAQDARERKEAKAALEYRRETKARKEAIKTRAQWYNDLQKEVNKHVRIRDSKSGCCTCSANNDIKYDAGHYRSRGACPELRFELTNIHKQCSVNCNQHGSGMRAEYRGFLLAKYGADHLEWLDGQHPSLKEQFPEIDDIRAEIARYRKLNREALVDS